MKKILIFIIIFFSFQIHIFASTGNTSWEINSITGAIEDQEVITSEEEKNANLIDKALWKRKEELNKILEESPEEKDIDHVQWLIDDLEIKKDLSKELLNTVREELSNIEIQINENNKKIAEYEELKEKNLIVEEELKNLRSKNQSLKTEIYFKETMINDLKNTLDSYKILEEKYNNLMESYIAVKKQKSSLKFEEINNKLKILFAAIIFFFIAFLLNVGLKKHPKTSQKISENFFAYYELFYTVFLTIFIIAYLFFVFPDLYILLIFVSWSIIIANNILISSFFSSIVIFKRFSIWDVIKMEKEAGKIIKISPLHTIIKTINEHGMIEKDEISIPNINLVKDRITTIRDIKEKDHYFSIILSLKEVKDIFKIIENIKENILLKYITNRPKSINPFENDIFKSKYEQIDAENIKITFYWIWSDEVNRKIEQKIIGFIKNNIFEKKENKKEESERKEDK